MSDYAHPESLVDAQWLAGHLGDPAVKPVEVAWADSVYGSEYASGHVPGAVLWDYY